MIVTLYRAVYENRGYSSDCNTLEELLAAMENTTPSGTTFTVEVRYTVVREGGKEKSPFSKNKQLNNN